uniref:EGF-like domain-containing protein n=2 Tax=Panagrolaimus sp. JU765 TaxID=591449 RepID=A0AC34PUW5_9BILA
MASLQFIFAFFIFFIGLNYCIDYTCNPCHDFGNCQPQNLLPNPYYSPSYPQYGGPNYCKSCTCPTGYSGQCCDTYKNPCSPNPCDSKHTCHSYNNLTHSCDCPTGKSGTNCEITDDPCANALCRPGSNCTANALATIGYTCACDSQYSGTYCETANKVQLPNVQQVFVQMVVFVLKANQ